MSPPSFNFYRQMPALDKYNNSEVSAVAGLANLYSKSFEPEEPHDEPTDNEEDEKYKATPFQKRFDLKMTYLLIAVKFAAKRLKESEELQSENVVKKIPTEKELITAMKKAVFKKSINKKAVNRKPKSPKKTKILKTGQLCSHCSIDKTVQWRTCKSYGDYLCNSCGTFISKLEKLYSYENVNIILDYLSDTPERRVMAEVKNLIRSGEIQLV